MLHTRSIKSSENLGDDPRESFIVHIDGTQQARCRSWIDVCDLSHDPISLRVAFESHFIGDLRPLVDCA